MSTSRRPGIVERLALAGARYIHANGGRPDVSVGTMRFALQLWISILLILILSCGIGLLLDETKEVLLALLSIGVLRYFSGGWHFKSLNVCIVFTVCVVAAIPLVPEIGGYWLAAMNGVSTLLVLWLAPTGHGQKFKSDKQKRLFRRIAATLVLLNFIFLDQVSTLSLLAQSLTLITYERRERHDT